MAGGRPGVGRERNESLVAPGEEMREWEVERRRDRKNMRAKEKERTGGGSRGEEASLLIFISLARSSQLLFRCCRVLMHNRVSSLAARLKEYALSS